MDNASYGEDQIAAAEVSEHGSGVVEHGLAVGDINGIRACPHAALALLRGGCHCAAIPVRQCQVRALGC